MTASTAKAVAADGITVNITVVIPSAFRMIVAQIPLHSCLKQEDVDFGILRELARHHGRNPNAEQYPFYSVRRRIRIKLAHCRRVQAPRLLLRRLRHAPVRWTSSLSLSPRMEGSQYCRR
jgi:hypothetical protein